MSEPLPEPLFSNVPQPEARPWRVKRPEVIWVLLLVCSGLGLWYWYSGRREHADEVQQTRINQNDLFDLNEARADADKQDSLWRLIDFPKRLSPVPAEQDAAALLQLAYDQCSSAQTIINEVDRYLSLSSNSFLSLNSLLKGKFNRHVVGSHYDNAFPCNRKPRAILMKDLQLYEAIFEPSRRLACQAAWLKQGSFPSLTPQFVESYYRGLNSLSRLLPAFTGSLLYEKYQAQNTVPVLLCQQTMLEWSQNKRDAAEKLPLIVNLAMLPDSPCPDNLQYAVNGCQPVFALLEWMLGQREPKETDLVSFQKRLEPLLRESRPLKTSFFCFRALANHYAELYAAGKRDIKREFGENSAAMTHNVFQGAAECVRFTTETIDKLNLPLADFDAWYSQKIDSYPGDATYHAEPFSSMAPRRFFRVMFLPHLKTAVEDYYYHQEVLRLTLVALACERYRLVHRQFPENSQQLRACMSDDAWADLFNDKSPIQPRLYSTPFGMVVTKPENAPSNPQDWESRICMNRPGYYVRIGFRLYRPELRGKPALPMERDSTFEDQ